jgi:hypothetical protein
MLLRRAVLVVVPWLASACSTPPPPAPPPVAEVPAAPTTTAVASAALEEPPAKAALITETGIGDIAIDAPFPSSMISAKLAERYTTTMYADAQPLEGFTLHAPPVFATVKGGPYHPFGMAQPGEPIPDTMPAEAVARAKAGKLVVKMVVVTNERPRTDKDVGVATKMAELRRVYPELNVFTLPGLWEEPSCVAKPRPDSKVHFFFKTCSGSGEDRIAADAPVIRVVVTDAGKN